MSEYIDNETKRKETLKRLIRDLHEGRTVEEVKDDFAVLLRDVGATEVAEIEQALISEGLPEDEVKQLCDVHVAVLREALDAQPKPETLPGHPVHTFRTENAAAADVLNQLKTALDAVLESGGGDAELEVARAQLRELQKLERHYLRKENILFPYLEKHGFSGPSSVMWAIHDDIRAGWKGLGELLSESELVRDRKAFANVLEESFKPLDTMLREMFYKEENILFPAAMDRLDEHEWRAIRAQEEEIGFCYVEPGDKWPEDGIVASRAEGGPVQADEDTVQLVTGALTIDDLNLLFAHLPVDVTYVDENDRVRFFSLGEDRIFPRSPAVIGREVQKCHPPASVDRVQRILDDFRSGVLDVAEFWIQMRGRFIHIRYFAMRDEAGTYRGALEVTQDVTQIRELEGERRLLDEEGK